MAGLCGYFLDGDEARGIALAPETLPAVDGAGHERVDTRGGACLVRGGWIARDEAGRLAAIAGHPVWRDPGLADTASARGHAEALLRAWLDAGDRVFERIGGDYVLALIDPGMGTGTDRGAPRLLAGIDRIGQCTLHFARVPGGVFFGSSAESVIAHSGREHPLDPAGIYQYLFHHMVPAPTSVFQGVEKLPGAHCLVHEGGATHARPYWMPRFEEPRAPDAGALMADLRGGLEQAVARHLGDAPGATGAFLSGGLDSSTVAGMLARLRPDEADTFSIGFDVAGYDEMGFARLAARHFGTRAHELYVTPEDVVSAVPLIAASYDEPFGNSSALPAFFCARMAAGAGMSRLLAGDGGDELFGGNERYARQAVFGHWQRVPAGLRSALLEPMFARLPAWIPLAGKARSYIEQARIPLPDRLHTYNFLHRLDPGELFEPDFLAAVDTDAPWSLMREIYARPDDASDLNRMMYLDWQHTLADNDLRKVVRTCQLAGVDVVFPMLDDELIELSLRVPSDLKLRRGRLRHFYKEAMTGFLPAAIIDKRKHGFGLPFGIWMREHRPLQELACDSLERLKGHGWLRPAFIDHLIDLHRGGHAAYYGELIWVLMMLDLWLDAHGHARSQSGPDTRRIRA